MRKVTINSFFKKIFSFALLASSLSVISTVYADAYQGPTGGRGGGAFYDKATSSERLAALTVRHGAVIDAVTLTYINTSTGLVRVGSRHGGGGGSQTNISLANGEKIMYVAGYWGQYSGIDVAQRLYIGTNFGHYYTLGNTNSSSRYFTYDNPDSSSMSVVGLQGRSGSLVDAIGVNWGKR